jgi:hypothetical protein
MPASIAYYFSLSKPAGPALEEEYFVVLVLQQSAGLIEKSKKRHRFHGFIHQLDPWNPWNPWRFSMPAQGSLTARQGAVDPDSLEAST